MHTAFSTALAARTGLIEALHAEDTDCYRLLHGSVEGVPGTAVDRYGSVLLVQTWREPLPPDVLPALVDAASTAVGAELVGVHNHRGKPLDFERWHPIPDPIVAEGRELGLRFDVNPRHRGADPLLFLDLRAVRRRIGGAASGATVLNLFAYTCGVGVAAAAGGASEVLNVDFAATALDVGRHNAQRNGVAMDILKEDCFPVMRQFAGLRVGRRGSHVTLEPRTFDLVILDPPRWSTSRFGAVDLIRDYASVFKPAVLCTAPGGTLVATNNVAAVDRDTWAESLHRCAQKAGRPLVDLEWVVPESDFPSPDDRPPLKVAWCRV